MEFTERQKEIVKKAIEIIADEGLNSLTTKRLAEKIGFSEPALYRHFKDKQHILIAVVRSIRKSMVEIVKKVDFSLPAEDFFVNLTCSLTGYLKQVKGVTILILSESSLNKNEVLRKEMYLFYLDMVKLVSSFLKEKKLAGEIKKELDNEMIAQLYLGIIQSMVLRHFLSGRVYDIDFNCKKMIDIFLRGILV